MKSKAEAIAENILNIILDKVMWNGESPYSKLIECVNHSQGRSNRVLII